MKHNFLIALLTEGNLPGTAGPQMLKSTSPLYWALS